ncbi:AraC family transcriptional regulator [Gorillibacterium sp. sgz5001074]|uniref:AraC family transcriptional regulator n=1 Tax=Gorillibacterium sp. sgz5001074 TaxID=3446695 RepID=UPI003F67AA04
MNYFDTIRESIAVIESRLPEGVAVGELADRCHMSRYYYQRIFKALTGLNVKEYIDQRRMAEAARLIRETDRRMLDIALDCGYGSHEAFTRKFKTCYGITPEACRRECPDLPIRMPLQVVEREFVHHHKELMVPFRSERLTSVRILRGRSRSFHPDREEEQDLLTEMVTGLAMDYGRRQEITVLYNVSCPDPNNGSCVLYYSGFEPAEDGLFAELEKFVLPAGDYAVFRYTMDLKGKHRTVIRDMFRSVLLAGIRLRDGDGIHFFERYGSEYKHDRTFEMWLPVQS